MYFLMVSSSNATVPKQYPRLRKWSRVTFLLPRIWQSMPTAILPLMNPIGKARLWLDGMLLTHIWIWSGIRCPPTRSIPKRGHTSLITSARCFFGVPASFLFQYFGMMTLRNFHSHRTWDRLCHSCIGSSSLFSRGTIPGEEPMLFYQER